MGLIDENGDMGLGSFLLVGFSSSPTQSICHLNHTQVLFSPLIMQIMTHNISYQIILLSRDAQVLFFFNSKKEDALTLSVQASQENNVQSWKKRARGTITPIIG